ncbi:ABC transporter permease [Spirochaeta lutea]|uniref:ABC transporter permease n=1 Tax=Spirochaeta lutea TaxID=1480694 RepID=UPI00068D6860|nr:iron ABC transporter permease [Spirochaeta lutea]
MRKPENPEAPGGPGLRPGFARFWGISEGWNHPKPRPYGLGRYGFWKFFLVLVSLALIIPLAGPLAQLILPRGKAWDHLAGTVLGRYSATTLILVAGVVPLSGILGTVSAWIVSRYRLPLGWMVDLLLILPLGLPSYLTAYAYAGVFDYFGPLHDALVFLGMSREAASGLRIQSLPGLIFVLTVSLYPYVYIVMRSRFSHGLTAPLEAARSLGARGFRQFWGVALPISRPALAGAMGIVLMEVLGEYGAVTYFGFDTLTTGVFKAWFGFYDLASAGRLGGMVILLVLGILWVEQRLRRNRGFSAEYRRSRDLERMGVLPWKAAGLGLIAVLPGVLGFLVPVMQILSWAWMALPEARWAPVMAGISNTLGLALGTALLGVVLSVFLGYARRLSGRGVLFRFSEISLLGHSIPGAVVSLGVLGLGGVVSSWLGLNTSVGAAAIMLLVFGYLVRFLSVAQRPISAALEHSGRSLDEAGRSLGCGPLATLLRVHVPTLGRPAAAGLVLMFLDIAKELPLTIILRPFNFNTLAVRAYELAANEMVHAAAIPSSMLVILGMIGVLLIRKRLL